MRESAITRGVINLLHQPRILLVDDLPDNLKLLGSLFDSSDIELSFAKNGIRALKLAEISAFELAILDINLPDIDGFELGRRIRELQPDCDIIFCSAHNDRANRDRGFLLGAIDFIEKPYDLDLTRTRIELHIERMGLRRQILLERDRTAAIVESIRDAVLTVNAKEIIVDANEAAEELFGLEDEQLTGKPMGLFFPENSENRSLIRLAALNEEAAGIHNRLMVELRAWQGKSFMAEITISAQQASTEVLYTALIRQITDSVTNQQLNRLYRKGLEQLGLAYLILTHEGIVLEQSAAFLEIERNMGLNCSGVGEHFSSCLIGSLFDDIKAGSRTLIAKSPCSDDQLEVTVFEDDERRPAYLLTFAKRDATA